MIIFSAEHIVLMRLTLFIKFDIIYLKCYYKYKRCYRQTVSPKVNSLGKPLSLVAWAVYFFFVSVYVTRTTLTNKAIKAIVSVVDIRITPPCEG